MKIPMRVRPRSGDIDMVPMISFVFLLLIFFLLIGRVGAVEPFDVLAPASARPGDPTATTPVLLMAANGDMAWDGERLPPDAVIGLAAQWSSLHPRAGLSLKADAAADAVVVIELLERLQAAGVTRLQLVTRPADGRG